MPHGPVGEEFGTSERCGNDAQQGLYVLLERSRDVVEGVGQIVVDEVEVSGVALSKIMIKNQRLIKANECHVQRSWGDQVCRLR